MALDKYLAAVDEVEQEGPKPPAPKKNPYLDAVDAVTAEKDNPYLAAVDEVEGEAEPQPETLGQTVMGGLKGGLSTALDAGTSMMAGVEGAMKKFLPFLPMPDYARKEDEPPTPLEFAKGVVTAPVEGLKQTRDVTQRVLAGENVSSEEIAKGWSAGALGLLGAYEMGAGGVKAAKAKFGSALPATKNGLPVEAQQKTVAPGPAPLDPGIRDLTGMGDLEAERQGGTVARVPQNPLEVPTELPAGGAERVVMPTDLPPADRTLAAPKTVQGPGFQWLRSDDPLVRDTPQPEISELAIQGSALDDVQPGNAVRELSFDRDPGIQGEPLGREMTPPEQATSPLQRNDAERTAALQQLYDHIQVSSAAEDVARSTLPLRDASAAAAGVATDASKLTKLSMREELGHQAQFNEQAWESLAKFRDIVEPMTDDGKLSFIHAIETGTAHELPTALQPAAETIRVLLDDARTRVQDLGTGKLDHFIENYFPHLWENPDELPGFFGRRPLKGPGSFLRERTIPTTREGIEAGLRPVTTNPLDLAVLRLREMNRYVMGQRVINELERNGVAKVIPLDARVPRGWTRVNDGLVPQLAAATPAAEVLNRYLSPGLQGNALFDAYKGSANLLNQVQLGFGAFHAGFVVMDATVSKVALGLEQLMTEGQRGKGVESIVKGITPGYAAGEAFRTGNQMMKAYFGDHASPAMKELMDLAVRGGARVRQDPFYKRGTNVEQFWKAWKGGEYGTVLKKALPAAVDKIAWLPEKLSRPILDAMVPRIKLGVAADLMRFEIEQLGDAATPEMLREAAARAWDSVDNRMGQLVYDNLFWSKAVKDFSLASVRSVGWNVGTIRELGGAGLDAFKTAGRMKAGGSLLTHRMAYAVALPLTVGLIGGVWNYLATGQTPQQLEDWFYPQTGKLTAEGNPERIQFPSYIRDAYEYGHGFENGPIAGAKGIAETLKHKVHPMVSLIADMLQNKDYFGNMVYNEHDPVVQQTAQAMTFVGKQFIPFSVQSQQRLGNESPGIQAGAFFGLAPAPRSITRTNAENLMHQYIAEKGTSSATPEEAEDRLATRELRNALEQAEPEQRSKLLGDALQEKKVTLPEALRLFKQVLTPASERYFKQLSYDQAMDVYNKGTPDEQRKWWMLLVQKGVSHVKETGENIEFPKAPKQQEESEAPYQ